MEKYGARVGEKMSSVSPMRRSPNRGTWARNATTHKSTAGQGSLESLTATPLKDFNTSLCARVWCQAGSFLPGVVSRKAFGIACGQA